MEVTGKSREEEPRTPCPGELALHPEKGCNNDDNCVQCLLCERNHKKGKWGCFVCSECQRSWKILSDKSLELKSGDEHIDRVKRFMKVLEKTGFYLRDVERDGNCLFYAIADQLHGAIKEHAALRFEITEYIRTHQETFAAYIDGQNGIEAVICKMRKQHTDCGQEALLAFSLAKGIQVMVHQPNQRILRINEQLPDSAPQIHLFFDCAIEHYQSLRRRGSRKRQPADVFFTNEEVLRQSRYYIGETSL